MKSTLTSPQTASDLISSAMPEGQIEHLPLAGAYGRRLAETVVADRDQPPFDRVTMDGIAFCAAALERGVRSFRVAGVHAAGAAQPELEDPDSCLEVMTGSVLPAGCDCVVPVEEIELADGIATLTKPASVEAWRFVHRRGTDYPIGQVLIQPGALIRGPELAVLASVGRGEVAVTRWPSALVVSTGDELVAPGKPVAAHQVRRANDYAIEGRLLGMGLSRVRRLHLPDDPALIETRLREGLADYDLLVLTGGVSRGRFDHVPDVLQRLGVSRQFHRVSQKPGKPMWFGVGSEGQPVFALPGNPVSALVCFHRYVEPALRGMTGEAPAPRFAELKASLKFANDLTRFVPVKLDETGGAQPTELNTSGDFFGLAGTDGFCELPGERRDFSAGELLRFYAW